MLHKNAYIYLVFLWNGCRILFHGKKTLFPTNMKIFRKPDLEVVVVITYKNNFPNLSMTFSISLK